MIDRSDDEVGIDFKNLEETDIEFGGRAKQQLDQIIDKNKKLLQAQQDNRTIDVNLRPGIIYRILDGECKGQYTIYYRDAVLIFEMFPNN
jgi:hypothetical protein